MIHAFTENYPFVEAPDTLKGVISDAYICLNRFRENPKPLCLTRIAKEDEPTRLEVTLQEQDSEEIVFDGVLQQQQCSITGYELYGNAPSANVVVQILIKEEFTGSVEAPNNVLDLRVVYTVPKHVNRITVQNHTFYNVGATTQCGNAIGSCSTTTRVCNRNIIFKAGNNIDLDFEEDESNEIRPAHVIVINAEPGAGLGRNQARCIVESSVTGINGLAADENGNIPLSGEPCYSIRLAPHTISLRNDCTPCCRCQAFTDAAKYLLELADLYRKYGKQAELVRDKMKELGEALEKAAPKKVDVGIIVNYREYPAPYGVLSIDVVNAGTDPVKAMNLEIQGEHIVLCKWVFTEPYRPFDSNGELYRLQEFYEQADKQYDISGLKPEPFFQKAWEKPPLYVSVPFYTQACSLAQFDGECPIFAVPEYHKRSFHYLTARTSEPGPVMNIQVTYETESGVTGELTAKKEGTRWRGFYLGIPTPVAERIQDVTGNDDITDDNELISAVNCEIRRLKAEMDSVEECYECTVEGESVKHSHHKMDHRPIGKHIKEKDEGFR